MNDQFFRRMKDQDGKDATHLMMIYDQLNAARVKHPQLAGEMTAFSIDEVQKHLDTFRFINDIKGGSCYHAILMEEICEAEAAYLLGEKDDCLKELAQVGAVVMRMMDFVEKNGQGKGK